MRDGMRTGRLFFPIHLILFLMMVACFNLRGSSQSIDSMGVLSHQEKGAGFPGDLFNACKRVFLPQNVAVGDGPFQFNIRALQGCEIQNFVDITLTFPFALFSIKPDTGIAPGPNFALMGSSTSKGIGMTEVSFKLARLAAGGPGEILATITADTGIGLPLLMEGAIDWITFRPDNGINLASFVPPVQVTYSKKPARPVFNLPGSVTSTSLVARWFPNSPVEHVIEYRGRILESTSEIRSATAAGNESSMSLEGLTPGTEYTLELIAVNRFGESKASTLQITTRFDRMSGECEVLLRALSRDWDPRGDRMGTLQSAIPSPLDSNLDGKVDENDALAVIHQFSSH